MPNKHIPLRSCVVCRQQKEKARLLRIVRTADGTIDVDTTGRAPGRGAYVCADGACMRELCKKHALNKVFKSQLPQTTYDRLDAQLKELIGDGRNG